MVRRKPPGMPVRTWIETQIARAEEDGAFADLPLAGRPLPRRDREQSSYEWALEWARREEGDDAVAGVLPPGMALRRERDLLPTAVEALPSEAAVRALAADYDDRVRAFWRRPQFTPDVVPGLADADALVEHWRATRPAPPPEPPLPPEPVQPPVSWARRVFRRR